MLWVDKKFSTRSVSIINRFIHPHEKTLNSRDNISEPGGRSSKAMPCLSRQETPVETHYRYNLRFAAPGKKANCAPAPPPVPPPVSDMEVDPELLKKRAGGLSGAQLAKLGKSLKDIEAENARFNSPDMAMQQFAMDPSVIREFEDPPDAWFQFLNRPVLN